MKATPALWTLLATLRDARLPLADWRRHFKDDFVAVQSWLRPCPGEIAVTVPCPKSGQRLQVASRARRYVAFPIEGFEGDAASCDQLSAAEVAVWCLDREALEAALGRALDVLPPPGREASSGNLVLLGLLGSGASRKPVYFGYAAHEQEGLSLCVAVARTERASCSMVLPSYYPVCAEYLRKNELDYIVLAEAVTLDATGIKARQSGPPLATEALVPVEVLGDYRALRLHDGTRIDLARRTKCRAFVRHVHQRRRTTGHREFDFDVEREKLNQGQQRIWIQSNDFKFGLFRGIHQHFDILFTSLDTRLGRYRINF
jgi:hypothetical protein